MSMMKKTLQDFFSRYQAGEIRKKRKRVISQRSLALSKLAWPMIY